MKRAEVVHLEIDRLRKELSETRNSNENAWNAYGSELCAGEMKRNEEEIALQIGRLEELLKMPEVDMDSGEIKGRIAKSAKRVVAIEQKRDKLSDKETKLSVEEQEEINYVARLNEIEKIPLEV
jgi:predicted secreted Zn-dependent protease